MYIISDINTNNYHSLEAQVTMRPTARRHHAVHIYMEQESRHRRRSHHDLHRSSQPARRLRSTCGSARARLPDQWTVPLPIGRGKKFLANSSGVLGRLAEGWQAGWIFNANTGQPLTISGNSTMYGYYVLGGLVANSPVDVVGPFNSKGKINWQQGADQRDLFHGK